MPLTRMRQRYEFRSWSAIAATLGIDAAKICLVAAILFVLWCLYPQLLGLNRGLLETLAARANVLIAGSGVVAPWICPLVPGLFVTLLVWLAIPGQDAPTPSWTAGVLQANLGEDGGWMDIAATRRLVGQFAELATACWLSWCAVLMLVILYVPGLQTPTETIDWFMGLPFATVLCAAIMRWGEGSLQLEVALQRRGAADLTKRRDRVERATASKRNAKPFVIGIIFTIVPAMAGALVYPVILHASETKSLHSAAFPFFSFAIEIAVLCAFGIGLAIRSVTPIGWVVTIVVLLQPFLLVTTLTPYLLATGSSVAWELLLGSILVVPSLVWIVPWWRGTWLLAPNALDTLNQHVKSADELRWRLETELFCLYNPGQAPPDRPSATKP